MDENQQKAINTTEGPLCIIAGPGSGKTHTITERILQLISEKNVSPENILAITFTNKAAEEMKARLLKKTTTLPTICTFHSLAYDILQKHGSLINLKKNFTVGDTKDKDISFDDLLTHLHTLFTQHEDTLNKYQDQFHYISVDEYQDTNPIQAEILKLLALPQNNICVIGDPNQAIYSFRGATLKNFLEFKDIFPNTLKIELNKNYRSTKTIIEASDTLVNKKSIAENAEGERITFYTGHSAEDEANFIAKEIEKLIGGTDLNSYSAHTYHVGDIAILYRLHAIGRIVEQKLKNANIPHQVVGKTNLFELPETKKILEYLKKSNENLPLLDHIKLLITNNNLKEKYNDSTEKEKYDNILQLQNYCIDFSHLPPEEGKNEFLKFIELYNPLEEKLAADSVKLMSVHASKGLEFPVVFIMGVEDGLFPYLKENEKNLPERVDEERRLLYGKTYSPTPSPFFNSVPNNLLEVKSNPKEKKKPLQQKLI